MGLKRKSIVLVYINNYYNYSWIDYMMGMKYT